MDLSENKIEVLKPSVFDQLTSLTQLALHKNLIQVIEDSLFAKNVNLEYLYLHENNIVAVGPNAFKHLRYLREMWFFGNSCMHPNAKYEKNRHQKRGYFFSRESGYRKWSNENNKCVSSYADLFVSLNAADQLNSKEEVEHKEKDH